MRICHECGYEPYLYDNCETFKSLSKTYVVSLDTPTYTLFSEENIAVVFNIEYNKKHLRSTKFECVVYNKIKIVNYDGLCYLTTGVNGFSVIDPSIFEDELKSITKEVKLFNITEKLRRIRSNCKEPV